MKPTKTEKSKNIIEICRWSEANWKLTSLLKSKAEIKWVLEEDYKDLQQENARLRQALEEIRKELIGYGSLEEDYVIKIIDKVLAGNPKATKDSLGEKHNK